jgi:hypothetical protein
MQEPQQDGPTPADFVEGEVYSTKNPSSPLLFLPVLPSVVDTASLADKPAVMNPAVMEILLRLDSRMEKLEHALHSHGQVAAGRSGLYHRGSVDMS